MYHFLEYINSKPRADNFDCFMYRTHMKDGNWFFKPNLLQMMYRMSCPAPSIVMRTSKSLSIGGFDERYRMASDYDHISRYLRSSKEIKIFADLLLVEFKGGGISEQFKVEAALEEELIHLRVWESNESDVCSRLLKRFRHLI